MSGSSSTARRVKLGQLMPGIVHEINTPTQYVTDSAHFLRGAWADLGPLFDLIMKIRDHHGVGPIPNDDAAQLVEAIGAADLEFLREEVPTAIEQSALGARRITAMVHAMHEFVRDDPATRSAFDVNQLIEQTLTVARNEVKYVADIETDLDDGGPEACGFAGEVSLAILHLLVCAAHAIAPTPGGGINGKGRIAVRTSRGAQDAELAIVASVPAGAVCVPDGPAASESGGEQDIAVARDLIVGQGGTLSVQSNRNELAFAVRLPAAS